MKFTFLSNKFYQDYTNEEYPQMELKDNRPYAHVKIDMYDKSFCIPLRSNITHPHTYWTNKKEKCGVDFSKVVIIDNEEYIDSSTKVYLRENEYKKLIGKDYIIQKRLLEYIDLYKQAKEDENVPHREDILNFSTLQYFEDFILDDNTKDTN